MAERNNKYDFYKGFLMWGVVWGHCITVLLNGEPNHNDIHLLLRTFDMPFFMLISGFFFALSIEKYSLKKLVVNKVTTILLPTVFWGIINSRFHNIGQNAFYFLYAVFFSSLIVSIINKNNLLSGWGKKLTLLLVIIVLHLQPYSCWNLPYLFPYFILGYYGFILNKQYNVPLCVILFVTCFCFWKSSYTVWNAGSNLLSGGILPLILIFRTIIAISGIIVVRELMDMLYLYLEQKEKRLFNFVVYSGKNTLALYILHSLILQQVVVRIVRIICDTLHYNPFNYNEKILGYILSPLLALFIIWMLLKFISWCKNHQYTNKLFGFKI